MNTKISRMLSVFLLLGLIVQAGFATFVMVNAQNEENQLESPTLVNGEGETQTTETDSTTTSVEISEEVQQKIKESDPDHFETHLQNYKNLLMDYQVHPKFKQEIERLVLEDYKIWNLLIAYEFLYHHFGKSEELEVLVVKREEQGTSWEEIFKQYRDADAAFIPRSFDSDELEKLMNTPGISSDDIMIADRISFESGESFETLITARMEGQSWQEINAQVDILYSKDQLPRVPVTSEQLDKFTHSTGLSEEQAVEAFVLAYKVGKEPKLIIEKLESGATEEAIFAESYLEKYR
ncbi:MAG: hypothetical protein H0Z33_17210 [Bacillaceae bacterium]|nr:hypothetical protein [Bacillaceae bacterium]